MNKFLFILFLFPFLLSAQNTPTGEAGKTIDSLILALKNAKHDTTRCNILSQLAEEATDEQRPIYNEKLKTIAEKNLKSYPPNHSQYKVFRKILGDALYNIGTMYVSTGDFRLALENLVKSLKISEEIGDKNGVAQSLNNIGYTYNTIGNIPMALDYYEKSLKTLEEIGDKIGISTSLNNIGYIYKSQGDIPRALDYFGKSLKIQESIGDKYGIAGSLDNIGLIYQSQGDTSKAFDYFGKELKICEEIGDKIGISASLNNIATVYKSQGDIPKTLDYLGKSLKIREEIGYKIGIAQSLGNIGTLYHSLGDVSKALYYLEKGLKIQEEIGDKYGIATSFYNIGANYLKNKNYPKALEFSAKSMKLSKELGFPENIKNAADALSKVFKATGNYKSAIENYELFIQMRDSINNESSRKASIKSQLKYDYEKQAMADSVSHAKENDIKNAEITARKAELKVKQNTQYALYGGLALVLIFAGFMFNRFKVTQKQKQIIEVKELETQQQKHLIEEKHKEITDSINYAERIQRSFIATKEILDEGLTPALSKGEGVEQKYFVLFKPKDVVSGDFYWASKLNNGCFALATADSTGHGVPGAIMSLLNITSLEKAIETLTEPAQILNATRKTIIERLKKDGSEHGGKDGMDASLTVYDFKNKKLIIAAANNPVWIMRKKTATEALEVTSTGASTGSATNLATVIEIKPDKMPVGKHDRDTVSFTQQEIKLQSGDVVYTLTDGFPDQFGGEKGKKFMSKNLRELLAANSHLPMHEQKQLLEKTFAEWVGNLEQVDDVTLIGVRI